MDAPWLSCRFTNTDEIKEFERDTELKRSTQRGHAALSGKGDILDVIGCDVEGSRLDH